MHEVIRNAGLDRFYDLRAMDPDRMDVPASPRDTSFEEYDDPAFQALHTRATADGTRRIDLYLEGVHCAACVWLIERLPEVLEGVISVRLDFGRAVATVLYEPSRIALSRIARTFDRFGYPPHPFRGSERRGLARREERKLLLRMGVAGAAAANVMLIAVALYAGAGSDPQVASLFRWVSLLVTLPTVLWSGQAFFSGAIAGLRARTLHMDLPVSLAIVAATASSAVHTVRGSGHVYFDSVTVLMFLLLAARWAQVRALRAASDASELLFSLAPSTARRVDADGSTKDVPVESLLVGQRVEVRAGESVPVDGLVERGVSRIDNSLLSGESVPVQVAEGAEVHAGAGNVTARLLVRVTATGENTRVGRLLAAVQDAQRRRAPIVQLADRIASYFVLAVLGLSAASALLWWTHGLEVVAERVVAMLVVTCPCALGLATPLALVHALGRAARNGIFIKGADTIEALAKLRHVLLDKTGTLTEGRVGLIRIEGDETWLPRMAALELHSSHLIARAIGAAVPRAVAEGHEVENVEEVAGAGVRGQVDGIRMAVGTPTLIEAAGWTVPSRWRALVEEAAARAETPVLVGADGAVVAMAAFGDPVRGDARAAVARLRELGLTPAILSGDHPAVVRRVAEQLGIAATEAQGAVTPEGKLAHVERMMAHGHPVAMIGDGVNDAGALAAARVGIAVRGGAELSLAIADAFLTQPGIAPAVELIRGCRRTLRVLYRNLGISLVYNAVGATLALAGLINPLVAAVLMPLSSISVVLSSVLSRPFAKGGRSHDDGVSVAVVEKEAAA